MKNDTITRVDLMALSFVALLSPANRAISESEIAVGEKGVYLSPIAAALPVLALFLLADRLSRRPEPLDGLFRLAFGKAVGGAVTIIFVSWITFYTGLALRVAGERLVSCVYGEAHWAVFAAVIAVGAAFAASGSVKTIVRTARLFLPIVVAALAVVFLMLFADVKSENLLPLTADDLRSALTGSLHMISAGSLFAYYGFLPAPAQKRREGIGYVAGVMAVMLAVTVTVVGVLGSELAAAMESPFFVVIRNVTLFNVLERIEAVVVALWVVSDLAFVSSMLCAAGSAVSRTVRLSRPMAVPILTAAAMAAAAFASETSFGVERIIQVAAPAGNIILLFFVLPLSAVVLRLRKL